MKIYYDKDADKKILSKKTIAIMGYGSQGHAHANNLKESGCHVIVGLRKGGGSWNKAKNAGFKVMSPAEAAAAAEVIMILLPDEFQAAVYRNEIAPNIRKGSYIGFAHGFNIHFNQIEPSPDINVFMCAPKGPGHLVRSEYERGGGVPCLIAVHQDPSKNTKKLALAYASGVGGGRSGIIETNFRED